MNRSYFGCVGLVVVCLCLSCRSPQGGATVAGFQGPIRTVGRSSPSTVLIVPTNEPDKAAEQGIHGCVAGMQKLITQAFPDRRVNVLTDSEALTNDLSHSAIYAYGTLQGNLWLARYKPQLPIVIEPNRITTDRVHEGSDLRLITAWPHPCNPKIGMIVYTAQRAQDVVAINSVLHGNTDYVVAQGQTVLQAGNYFDKAGRWTCVGGLSLAQATEDLDFLFKTIEQTHPNHLANLSKEQYRQLKDRSQAALAKVCEAKGYVPQSVLGLTAARAAASFGDGHTSFHLGWELSDVDDSTVCMPPFRLKWQAGQVVIDRTIAGLEHLRGACLSEINGRPFAEAVSPILAHVSGEREAFRIISFLGSQDLHWALVRPIGGPEMTVTVRRGTSEPQSVRAPLISRSQYRRELPLVRDVYPAGTHAFHHDGRICYWRFDSFDVSGAAKKAIDAVFEDIRGHNARNLIIDLRFNGGGSSEAADYILGYLTSKRYRVSSRIDIKVSKQLRAAQSFGMLDLPARLFHGRVVSFKQPSRRPRDMGYRFDGSVYVIAGPGTFSSAADFVHIVKDYHLGTVVGEETGGLRLCFGDCPGFQMPYSNLPFAVSTKRFHAPIPMSDDATRGTFPDVQIDENGLAPFLNAADPELAFALDLVARRDATPPG